MTTSLIVNKNREAERKEREIYIYTRKGVSHVTRRVDGMYFDIE